ncbi:MAG: hypothetical protein IJX81_05015 [Clostridia bacterium]|nr:hypothetical protein [Clostridia bacterium]
MDVIKEIWIKFWKHVWEGLKSSFVALLMYFGVSSIVFMTTFQGEFSTGMTGTRAAWVFGGAAVALAYHAFTMFASGTQGYEMLVSGNMKRRSAQAMGSTMKISSHKEEKEFRYWKGFVAPWIIVLLVVATGIVFGKYQADIDAIMLSQNEEKTVPIGLAVTVLVLLILSGWSVLPFFFFNMGGMAVSYYWSIALAALPVILSGVFYIVGAYAARNKAVKKQEEADRASRAVVEKPQKINYGGLPGTKPKKKK